MSNNIRKIREERGVSQEELANLLGVKRPVISKYENGVTQLTQNILNKLCDIFDLSADYILGRASAGKLPVLGTIRAGEPTISAENIDEYIDAGAEYTGGYYNYFALEVKGNSMEPAYRQGDIIIVKSQSSCDSGKDAVVIVGDDEATLKRYFVAGDTIILQPLNPAYKQMVFTLEEAAKLPIKIVGTVVELRRKID